MGVRADPSGQDGRARHTICDVRVGNEEAKLVGARAGAWSACLQRPRRHAAARRTTMLRMFNADAWQRADADPPAPHRRPGGPHLRLDLAGRDPRRACRWDLPFAIPATSVHRDGLNADLAAMIAAI
jgi:hypothetical protein